MGHGWEVVERYISGEKGYEKTDTVRGRGELYSYDETWAMPVVVIDKAKGKTHKTGCITLHIKLFKGGGVHLKNMCRIIKGVWTQILSSFSKGLSIYQV